MGPAQVHWRMGGQPQSTLGTWRVDSSQVWPHCGPNWPCNHPKRVDAVASGRNQLQLVAGPVQVSFWAARTGAGVASNGRPRPKRTTVPGARRPPNLLPGGPVTRPPDQPASVRLQGGEAALSGVGSAWVHRKMGSSPQPPAQGLRRPVSSKGEPSANSSSSVNRQPFL